MKTQEISKSKILDRISELTEKINRWNNEYYELSKPTVDDSVFDAALHELIKLEKQYPEFIKKDSPTQKVGGSVNSNFEKREHIIKPMLSLSNAFSNEDLFEFEKRIKKNIGEGEVEYTIEPKIDGISISLHYKEGKLFEAITRGDGKTGEVVTENVKQIKNIPQEIPFNQEIVFRGEIYMPISSFENINNERYKNNEDPFANPRNATSGTIRQLDSNVVKERKLDIFVYFAHTNNENEFESQDQALEFIKQMGFPVSKLEKKVTGIKNAINVIESIESKREILDYEIDGIVIKVNNISLYDDIGYTTKFPKWAIAYKFPAEVKETKLIDIFPTVGRTGRITYNAKLEPVTILGTVVKAATLHNAEYIKSLDIRIGDIVQVKKAGDIIPKIIGFNSDFRKVNFKKWQIETTCPSCNSKLEKLDDEVDQYCINADCPARRIESLIHFCSRDAMNIEGLAEKQIENFVNKGLIKTIEDIFLLKNHRETIISFEGYQEKSVNKLLDSIEKSKSNSLERILFGFGIRYIGKKTCLEIAMSFNDVDQLVNIEKETLLAKTNLGHVKSQSLYDWFSNESNIRMLSTLKEMDINLKYSGAKVTETPITNKKVVITGTIDGGNRNEIKEMLISFGANISSAPSSQTEILFVGKNASDAKIQKAVNASIIKVETIEDIKNYVKRY